MSPNEPAVRAAIAAEALSWVGTPYLHEGLVKGLQGGVDCCMILVGVYRDGVSLVPADLDPRPYPMQWYLHRDSERYLEWFTKYARQVEEPQVGDVALYRFGRTVSHSGIIVDKHNIVHAYRQSGKVIKSEMRGFAHRFNSYWSLL